MKRFMIALSLTILIAGVVPAVEFEQVEFRLFATVPDLTWGIYNASGGIDHFAFDNDDRFVVWDKMRERLLVQTEPGGSTEQEFSVSTEHPQDTWYTITIWENSAAIVNVYAPFIIVDLTNGSQVSESFSAHGIRGNPSGYYTVYIDRFLIYEEPNRAVFHSFQIIETDDGLEAVYRDPDETRAFVEETYEGTDGFHYDDEGYLFYGERLVTANGATFASYFRSMPQYDDNPEIGRAEPIFLGVDSDGNYYWNRGNFVLVYGKHGESLAYFRFDRVPEKGRLQIDPYGNIYVLSYGGLTPGQLDLLWIENTWLPVEHETSQLSPTARAVANSTVVVPDVGFD